MMTSLGLGAGALAGLAVVGLPAATAVAAPAANHVAAWNPLPKALGATSATLTYLNIDATAFHSYSYATPGGGRYLDATSGVGALTPNTRLATPLLLPVGSVIKQINVAYQGQPIIEVFKRDFVTNTQTWNPSYQQTLGAGGGVKTQTLDLASPITIQHGASYSLQFFATSGSTVYGITLGYVPPTSGFVPFTGSPRVLDTRPGQLPATGPKGKVLAGAAGEITVDLGTPGVRGALLNLTVTDTELAGFAGVFDASIAWPENSSINWTGTGVTIANAVVTAVAPNGTIKIRVDGNPSPRTHVIVDRLGWFV